MAEQLIAKKLAKISGLHQVFALTENLETDAQKPAKYAYKPELLSSLPSKNGATVDKNSLMFVVADSTDNGKYVYVGQTISQMSDPIIVETGDVFIWVQDMIVATNASYIDNILVSNAANAKIVINREDNGTGEITLSASHSNADATAASGSVTADSKVITKISYDSTGHVISVDSIDASDLDTTYAFSNTSSTAGSYTLKLTGTKGSTNDIDGGSVSIDSVKYLVDNDGNKVNVTSSVVSDGGVDTAIPTLKAVITLIKNAIVAGSKFQGVDTTANILAKGTSGANAVGNGDMWKISAVSEDKKTLGTAAANEDDKDINLKTGDVLIAKVVTSGETSTLTWYLVPSGDDIEDTWRPIKIKGTEVFGSGLSSNDLDLSDGDKISVSHDSGVVKFNHDKTTAGTVVAGEGATYHVIEGMVDSTLNPISKIIFDEFGHIVNVEAMDMSLALTNSIKGVTFAAATDEDNATGHGALLSIGLETNDTTKTASTLNVHIAGANGVTISAGTDGSANVLTITGTTYSTAETTVADRSATGDESGVTITTGINSDLKSHSIVSKDSSIKVSATSGVVNIDYTGSSTEDDWFTL